jgi:uncharacterized protein (DUF1015 family)
MATVKPFKAIRPPKEIIEELACLPYDVMNSEEAAQMAEGKERSLLHITRAEIDMPTGTDVHSQEVYDKSKENFKKFMDNGWLVKEEKAKYYVYAQTMDGRTQYGIVANAAVEDYLNDVIKKHELTRRDKEDDRMIHVKINNANIEPVFLTYPAVEEIDAIVTEVVENNKPVYDFVAEDGFGHHFWVIEDDAKNAQIEELFATKVPFTYVAEGHHRSAAAARVGAEKREANSNHTGDEEYNYFLAVHFPDNQLKIIDYNRVVKDLNGLSEVELIDKIKSNFEVQEMGADIYKPSKLHEFSMYLDKKWYKLTAKDGSYTNDPIGALDVTILSNHVLNDILGIEDLRTSKRIDFVGGIRGLGELSRRVDSGEMKVAFALYEVSMKELINIADTGNIMPPKTTWFEPKLRSGLAIHSLED